MVRCICRYSTVPIYFLFRFSPTVALLCELVNLLRFALIQTSELEPFVRRNISSRSSFIDPSLETPVEMP